jgi:glutamate/tyrosine decarboxylase-like PLP-dependent enzyme
MYDILSQDQKKQADILKQVCEDAVEFLEQRNGRPVAPVYQELPLRHLPPQGIGAEAARKLFAEDYLPWIPASSGSRYYGYVIGGVTPAALAGDWYTSLYDQNAFGHPGTVDRQIESESIQFIRDLLDLPKDYFGVFVSGATMSAMTAMVCARQWAAAQSGHCASEEGLYGLERSDVASGLTHGANYKALSMAGLGRKVDALPLLPGREAVDPVALEAYLASRDPKKPLIYIANMGTASSGDHDDLNAIAKLKDKYRFWLHVDGAFGGMMACSPKFADRFKYLGAADSITMDTHKWLNVPYDGAVILCKHPDFQFQSFTNALSATGGVPDQVSYYHMTPEGSRRLRALPVWFSLLAYGKEGYAELCERTVSLCEAYGRKVEASPYFRLLNQVRGNVVCFTLNLPDNCIAPADIQEILDRLQSEGVTYSNMAYFYGKPALRVCLTNWMTEAADVDAAFASMENCSKDVFERLRP